MNTIQPSSNSTFDQMIDKLRGKSQEELKLLYLKFFSNDLNQEWEEIISTSSFDDASDEEIILAIQKQRYND